jgi:hypothetical protein
MLERTHSTQAVSRCRAAAGNRGLPASPEARARVPECATERWKHRVEAEARGRLKREVRGVGPAH